MSLRSASASNGRNGHTPNVAPEARSNAQLWSALCAHPASAPLVHVDRTQQSAALIAPQGADTDGRMRDAFKAAKNMTKRATAATKREKDGGYAAFRDIWVKKLKAQYPRITIAELKEKIDEMWNDKCEGDTSGKPWCG